MLDGLKSYTPYIQQNKRTGAVSDSFVYSKKPISTTHPSNLSKQELPCDLYFVNMKHYGKNEYWGKRMADLTEEVSKKISNKEDFDSVLKTIEDGVRSTHGNALNCFGTKRENPLMGAFLIRKNSRGEEYYQKYYDKLFKSSNLESVKIKSTEEYKDANTCLIKYLNCSEEKGFYIKYGYNGDLKNFKLAKKEYQKLLSKKNPSISDINKSVATIHWLIAQESPYSKGNDSIANVLSKSIYHSFGVKVSPLKDGISIDFEAFYTDLKDFIANYPKLFKIRPYILNSFVKTI